MCPILTDVGARAEAGEQLGGHAIIQVRDDAGWVRILAMEVVEVRGRWIYSEGRANGIPDGFSGGCEREVGTDSRFSWPEQLER